MSDRPTGLVKRTVGPLFALGLTLVLLYLSRFWIWVGPWSSDGLFGLKLVSPYGSMVNFWLRGTWWQTFDIVIWGCGAFILLTVIQRVVGLLSR